MPSTSSIRESHVANIFMRIEAENRANLTCAGVLTVCGVVCFGGIALLPVWASVFRLWTADPLRTIGGFFPIVALVGTIAVWRRTGWRNDGTWWGFALAVLSMAVATLFSSDSLLTFFFHREVRLLHPGMAAMLYGVGATLLFAGKRVLRLSIVPLCLLLFINPVPTIFQSFVDMPLQIFSANIARGFAHAIGLQPTGDELRMMFAPHFGMMIVPGCNGLRGAITLGYLALVCGYIRRISPPFLAVITASGVMLGYLLNLLRLCVLVCYYRLGLSVPSIQNYGTQIDYVIGISLFLSATLVIGWTAELYFEWNRKSIEEIPQIPGGPRQLAPPLIPRVVLLAVAGLAFVVPQARSVLGQHNVMLSEAAVVGTIPHQVGLYTLKTTWDEFDSNGNLMFVWGQFQRQDTGSVIALGIYLGGEDHLVVNSKRLQGVIPVWSGTLNAPRRNARPIRFITNFYSNRETRTMDAETSCNGQICELNGGVSSGSVSIVAPRLENLFIAPAENRFPLILREEWNVNAATSNDHDAQLRSGFVTAVSEFVVSLDLNPLLAQKR